MSYDEVSREDFSTEAARDTRAKVRQGPQPGDALGGRQSRLWRAAEALDNTLDTLTERMSPVLLPLRPSPALSGIAGDTDERSDLGSFLDQLAAKLDHLGMRAADLSERVDL